MTMYKVTQADRDLYTRLIGLHRENRLNREKNRPIVEGTQLIAAHRLATLREVERHLSAVQYDPDAMKARLQKLMESGE